MWERSLLLQSFMLCVLGGGLMFILVLLSVTPELLQVRFGGALSSLGPFIKEPWNLVWGFVCLFGIFLCGYLSTQYHKRAQLLDPEAFGSEFVERALWRRVILTFPVVLWCTGSIWMIYFAWQNKNNEQFSAMAILRDPSLFQALLLYGLPLLFGAYTLLRSSKRRRFDDDY